MTIDQNILNEVINLQAHFRSGYDRATILRKRQEGHFSWQNGELVKSVKNGNNWTTFINGNFN